MDGAAQRKKMPHVQGEDMGHVETSPLGLIRSHTCPPAHPPGPRMKPSCGVTGRRFFHQEGYRHVQAAFLSCTKGHSFRVMREGQAVGKGGDNGLGTFCAGQGGRPQAILPAGALVERGSGSHPGHGLRPPPDPWGPLWRHVCLCSPHGGGLPLEPLQLPHLQGFLFP